MKGFTILTLLSYVCLMESLRIHVQKRYTKEDVCTNTTPTLKKVDNCPKDRKLLLEKSQEKKCHLHPPCQGEPLVFHCIRYQNGFAEVCAPKESITGNCCAEFDEGLGRIREDFSLECSECPFQYNSTETSLYSECLIKRCKGSNRNKRSTKSKRSVDHGECKDSGNKKKSNTFPVHAPVIAILVLFIGILLSILYKYKCVFFKNTTASRPQNGTDTDSDLNKESSLKLLEKNKRSPSISEMHSITILKEKNSTTNEPYIC